MYIVKQILKTAVNTSDLFSPLLGMNVYRMIRSPKQGALQSPWAVKKVNKKATVDAEVNKRLYDEAKLLRNLKHKNIVGFRGLAFSPDGTACLAMEDCHTCLRTMIEVSKL